MSRAASNLFSLKEKFLLILRIKIAISMALCYNNLVSMKRSRINIRLAFRFLVEIGLWLLNFKSFNESIFSVPGLSCLLSLFSIC